MKTIAFFSVLSDRGCSFQIESDGSEVCVNVAERFNSGDEEDSDAGEDSTADEALFSGRARRPTRDLDCTGRIVLKGNRFGRSYVQ